MENVQEGGGIHARVVVVGAGFAGGSFLRNLPPPLRRPGATFLVDRGAEHEFAPLVHEVAVGRVHPDSVRFPIVPDGKADPGKASYGKASYGKVPYGLLNAEVTGMDLETRVLRTSSGEVRYEYLILAPGGVAVHPPAGLAGHFRIFWSLDDALALRKSLNEAWRAASGVRTGVRTGGLTGGLTVALVGGGATGVELAAEIAALFGYLKRRAVRKPAEEPRVVLLEATDHLMGWLEPYFHDAAMEELARLGVEVRLNAPVTAADENGVEIGDERIAAATRVWVTGVEANPLIRELPGEHDEEGRVRVDEHLTLSGHPEVYVLGDSSLYEGRLGPLPPTASVAVQQGPYAAHDLKRRLRGAFSRRGRPPFRFIDRGYVVSLGPENAVGTAFGVKLRGPAAQALYRSVFLYYIRSHRGRILTGADWAMERTLGRVGFDPGKPGTSR